MRSGTERPAPEPTMVDGPDGLAFATWDLGGSGPDLLLVHATGFHSLAYRAIADEVADRRHVVGVDLRGHGRSPAPPLDRADDGSIPALAWERFATDVLAVVDALGLERPTGFGHSCGGATLLLAEAARPGTFAAIHAFEPVILEPGPRPRPSGGLAAGALRRRRRFASLQAAFDNYRSKPPFAAVRADVLWDYVAFGFAPVEDPDLGPEAVELRCSPEVESATFEMAGRATTWEHLSAVRCPVRFTCGGPTGDFRLPLLERVADRLADATAEELTALSHFGPFERPDEVAANL